jgi:hypothetical protein
MNTFEDTNLYTFKDTNLYTFEDTNLCSENRFTLTAPNETARWWLRGPSDLTPDLTKVMYSKSYKQIIDEMKMLTDIANNIDKYSNIAIKEKENNMYIEPGYSIGVNAYTKYFKNIINIDIKDVIVNNKVVKVIFIDGTSETATCAPEDDFDLEIGITICIMKHIYCGSGAYNKAIRKAADIYYAKEEKKKAEIAKKKEEKEARKRKLEKHKKRLAKKREKQIEIQKEAYVRAMRELAKEDKTKSKKN